MKQKQTKTYKMKKSILLFLQIVSVIVAHVAMGAIAFGFCYEGYAYGIPGFLLAGVTAWSIVNYAMDYHQHPHLYTLNQD
jgi:flagellar basal body-associated protein FliL